MFSALLLLNWNRSHAPRSAHVSCDYACFVASLAVVVTRSGVSLKIVSQDRKGLTIKRNPDARIRGARSLISCTQCSSPAHEVLDDPNRTLVPDAANDRQEPKLPNAVPQHLQVQKFQPVATDPELPLKFWWI